MFCKKSKTKSGREYLSIVEGFRDKDGVTRQKTVQTIGYVDEFTHLYDDPYLHFQEVATQMGKDIKDIEHVTFNRHERLAVGTNDKKNIGSAAISAIYHQFELDYFINNRRRYEKKEFNHNTIFKLLIYNRILFPTSKRGACAQKDYFFEKMDFSLDDIYHSLEFFIRHKDAMLYSIHKKMCSLYKRDTTLVYYDVTNYYFEVDEEKDEKMRGVSKEHQPRPIIQMGLFMDLQGIPITYELFDGNTHDSITFSNGLTEIKKKYDIRETIFVGDKGLMSGNNLRKIRLNHNGYVISYSLRKGDKDTVAWALSDEGFVYNEDRSYGHKSRIAEREIRVSNLTGGYEKVLVWERQIVMYSEKYAKKSKADRTRAIEKALNLTQSPGKYKQASNYGALKYVKQTIVNSDGKKSKDQVEYSFDSAKLAKEEQFDGYYMITTNVIGTNNVKEMKDPDTGRVKPHLSNFYVINRPISDEEIIKMYRGLWKIEETFRVTKTAALNTRPVYLSKKEHIQSHFLMCFVSLVILRVLQLRLDWKYSAPNIAKSLSQATGNYFTDGYYVFAFQDEVLEALEKDLGIPLANKYINKGDARTILSKSKNILPQ
jgi:transposase